MRGLVGKVAVGALALAAFGISGTAQAADPVITVGADGKTAPVFSYQDAIRERVFIPVDGVDSDNDGITDRVSIDIVRPKESGPTLKMPAVIDPSPYYTSLGRGNESQRIHTTAAGVLDRFPLYYDNYFVPRGYAFIAADALGTAFSTGCALHGGPTDVAGFKAVIDWTNGRVPGYTSRTGTTPVTASWSTGKNAMIGKSYDGTFANGVAATGVDGLTTIVPVSAISDWYDYSRMGGIRFNTDYPSGLSSTISSDQPASVLGVQPPQGAASRNTICNPTRNAMAAIDGDETGDINTFWNDRDYNKDVSKVKASVFISHGINDDNVRPNHFSQWWAGLAANNVPRKMWLALNGHVDPFEYRRTAWVDTLHRWFDYWLQGVNNGIMNEPRVDVETAGDTWATYADWPIPDTVNTDVYLGGRSESTSGSLLLGSGGSTDTLQFQDLPTGNLSEATATNSPNGSQANRRVFLSPKLKADVHISGTPIIDIQASLSTTQSNIAALLVDYGQASHVGRGGSDGVSNTNPAVRTCWGESSTDAAGDPVDSACYIEVTKPVQNVTTWRVSKGILDSANRDSLFTATPGVAGTKYEFKFPVLPTEYTFPAGHQIGVVLIGNFSQYSSVVGPRGAAFTLDTKASKVVLPITGGSVAAQASGGFVADTTAPVWGDAPDQTFETTDPTGMTVNYTRPTGTDTQDGNPTVSCTPAAGTKFAVGNTTVTCALTDANGNAAAPKSFNVKVLFVNKADGGATGTVPATLSLTLGSAASFGAFTPGIAKDYAAQTTATVISTAANAALSVADPSSTATGHLVNNTFSLPSALQANAGGPFADVGGSAAPTLLKSWTAPTSNEAVTIAFQQHVSANDALRTGAYSKTLTFTLSTTAP
jgi:X-Pro dipeptidyl-peptidase